MKDTSGRNCFVIAALSGTIGVLTTLKNAIPQDYEVDYTIEWSESNISAALNLVSKRLSPPILKGYGQCLELFFSAGFTVNMCNQEGVTLLMMACKFGREEIIIYLMNLDADFSMTDINKKCALHYAAMCRTTDVLSIVFSHPKAASCNLTSSLLASKDSDGCTPLHIAATENVIITIGFVARHGIDQALAIRDEFGGMNPLLLACSYNNFESIRNLVQLGASVHSVDDLQRGCIWHLFHKRTTNYGPSKSMNRPIASEVVQNLNLSKEIGIIQFLLEEGSPLFTSNEPSMGDLIAKKSTYDVDDFALSVAELEAAEIAIFEQSARLYKMLPKLLSPKDCWRTGYKILL
jgi:ankyrin repeat protein